MTALGWLVDCDGESGTVDIVPIADEVDHERGPDCVCGPSVGLVSRADGGGGTLTVHAALDGREAGEAR